MNAAMANPSTITGAANTKIVSCTGSRIQFCRGRRDCVLETSTKAPPHRFVITLSMWKKT